MLGFISQSDQVKDPTRLVGLDRNAISTIQGVEGSEQFQKRMKSVGIVAGSRIKVLRTGCPIVVHSEGGRFCLRKEDALRIRIHSDAVEAAS